MKNQNDELRRLRHELRLRIDKASKSAAEALQAAADLLIKVAQQERDVRSDTTAAKTTSAPEMMTSNQAAEYLGVATQTLAVWRMTGRHSLPFVKVGRSTRYRRSDLDKFLQRCTYNCEREEMS